MQPAAASWNRAVSAESVWSIERGDALDRNSGAGPISGRCRTARVWMAQIATRDADDAMDLVQEAMLKLVQHYASRDEAEWGPLFHRILQSKIRDWYRRASVRNRLRVWFGHKEDDEESNALEQVPDTSSVNADEQLSQKRTAQALEVALRDLPLRQQQAFLLRVWEEYDVADGTDHGMLRGQCQNSFI